MPILLGLGLTCRWTDILSSWTVIIQTSEQYGTGTPQMPSIQNLIIPKTFYGVNKFFYTYQLSTKNYAIISSDCHFQNVFFFSQFVSSFIFLTGTAE